MVTQNNWRTCEGKQIFLMKENQIAPAVDLNKYFKQIKLHISIRLCATTLELPSDRLILVAQCAPRLQLQNLNWCPNIN